jgi:hypothetical protein
MIERHRRFATERTPALEATEHPIASPVEDERLPIGPSATGEPPQSLAERDLFPRIENRLVGEARAHLANEGGDVATSLAAVRGTKRRSRCVAVRTCLGRTARLGRASPGSPLEDEPQYRSCLLVEALCVLPAWKPLEEAIDHGKILVQSIGSRPIHRG